MPKKLDVTVEQLRSIYGQLYDLLEEKAALHLPNDIDAERKGDHTDDNVKREVQIQLQEFLTQVMDMASNSLRVVNIDDGDMEASGKRNKLSIKDLIMKSQEKYVEPFDLELNEKVRKSYQEWEDQTVKVSQLRQNGPNHVNQLYVKARDQFLSQLDSRIENLQESTTETPKEEDKIEIEIEEEVSEDEQYWQSIKEQYEQSLTYLHDAQTQLPQTRSDLNKIKNLIAYLETEID